MKNINKIANEHKGTECPVCGLDYATRCRCRIADSTCPNGHKWFCCPIHGIAVIGDAHELGVSLGQCACNLGKESRMKNIKKIAEQIHAEKQSHKEMTHFEFRKFRRTVEDAMDAAEHRLDTSPVTHFFWIMEDLHNKLEIVVNQLKNFF